MLMLRLRRSKSRAILAAVMMMGSIDGHAQKKGLTGATPRYLYILNCGAILQKFDILARHQLSTSNLAKYSKLIPTHGDQANSVVDGCATYGAAYQADTSTLYTVVPTTGSIEEGAFRHYRILSFRLPSLAPADVIELPGKYSEGEIPILKTDRSAQVGVIEHDGYRRILHGHLVPANTISDPMDSYPSTSSALPPEVNLSSYRSANEASATNNSVPAYTPVLRSGDIVLLQFLPADRGWLWAAANTRIHRLTRLDLPFQTTNNSVYLIPGGDAAVAQEAHLNSGVPVTTGRLALIDTGTGTITKTWTDPAFAGKFILTITPQGDVVSFYGESTTLVPIGIHPSGEPVLNLRNTLGPYYFYANR